MSVETIPDKDGHRWPVTGFWCTICGMPLHESSVAYGTHPGCDEVSNIADLDAPVSHDTPAPLSDEPGLYATGGVARIDTPAVVTETHTVGLAAGVAF